MNINFLRIGQDSQTLAVFFRQFVTLLKAGIPIARLITILIEQSGERDFRRVLEVIHLDVCVKGMQIHQALQKHPRVFNSVHVNMVKAGETGGALPSIIEELAVYQEKSLSFQRKVKGALTYPMFVALSSFIILLIMVKLILPVITSTASMIPGNKLSLPTKIIFHLALIFDNPLTFMLCIVLLLLIILFLREYIKTPAGRAWLDTLLLRVPVLGPLLNKVFMNRFCITLETLLSSGIPIITSFQGAASATGNIFLYEKIVHNVIVDIREGVIISKALQNARIFPPILIHLFQAGEMTGQVKKMLRYVSRLYELDVDVALTRFTLLIEPVLTALLGIVVCIIVLGALLPIYQAIESL